MPVTRTFTVVPVVRWVVREATSHPEQGAGSCGELAELRNEEDARRVAKAMTDASATRVQAPRFNLPDLGPNTAYLNVTADGRAAGQGFIGS